MTGSPANPSCNIQTIKLKHLHYASASAQSGLILLKLTRQVDIQVLPDTNCKAVIDTGRLQWARHAHINLGMLQGWDKYWRCYKAGDKCCVPACANGWDECAEVELQVCVGGACCRLLQHEDMCVEDKPRLG